MSYDFSMTSSLKSPVFFFPIMGFMNSPSTNVSAVFCTYSCPMCGGFLVWNATISLHSFSLNKTLVSCGVRLYSSYSLVFVLSRLIFPPISCSFIWYMLFTPGWLVSLVWYTDSASVFLSYLYISSSVIVALNPVSWLVSSMVSPSLMSLSSFLLKSSSMGMVHGVSLESLLCVITFSRSLSYRNPSSGENTPFAMLIMSSDRLVLISYCGIPCMFCFVVVLFISFPPCGFGIFLSPQSKYPSARSRSFTLASSSLVNASSVSSSSPDITSLSTYVTYEESDVNPVPVILVLILFASGVGIDIVVNFLFSFSSFISIPHYI